MSAGKLKFYTLVVLLLSATLCVPAWAQVCGNAILESGETCDDGNAVSGDGCSGLCLVEQGWECTLPLPPTIINGVGDGSFEAGTPNPTWTEASTNSGTPLCTIATCGASSGANTGEWWAFFGGEATLYEASSLEQSVLIETGDTELTFMFEASLCDTQFDYLRLTIDGNEVFSIDGNDTPCNQYGYTQQVINLATAPGGPYNDNAYHLLRFESETEARNGASNFFVDDVIIDRGLNPSTPSVCTPLCFGEDFDPGSTMLPAGWTVFNTGALDWEWGTSDDLRCNSESFFVGNFTGGEGEAACIDSDAAGPGIIDAYLCSAAIDLTEASGAILNFKYNYQIDGAATGNDIFDVMVGSSTPGPGTIGEYSTVFSSGGTNQGTLNDTPGAFEVLDFTGFEGQTIHLCFRYGADFEWYAQVDDIRIEADTCVAVPPPAMPTGVSASDGTYADKVVVSWGDVAGEDSYQVFRCADATTGSCSEIATPTADVTAYDDTGANSDGTMHYYRVKACSSAGGCSAYSDYDSGYRQVVALPEATTSAATDVAVDSATLNGSVNPNGTPAYGYFRYDTINPGTCNDSFGTRLPATSPEDTAIGDGISPVAYSRAVSGLVPGTTYYYCALGRNTNGTSFGSVMNLTPGSTYCNVNSVSGTTELIPVTYEACDTLVFGPDFIAANGSSVSANSGREIGFLPGFLVESGASLNAKVCGQSLCMTSPSPMPDGCHSCVDQICDINPGCCATEFNQACLDLVGTACGLVCE